MDFIECTERQSQHCAMLFPGIGTATSITVRQSEKHA